MNYPDSYNELEKWRDELRQTVAPADRIRAMEDRIKHESDQVRLDILKRLLAREHIAQGNPDAAAAIRAADPFDQVHRWIEEWFKANPDADIIPVLQEKLRTEPHSAKIRALRHFLATEYMRGGDYEASVAVHRDDALANPDEPMPLITLASQTWYAVDRPQEAMRIINQAVEVALRAGTFRRYALGEKARIALALEDHQTVEDVLKQIMELTFTRGNADIGAERDFLDNLPPHSIDAAVARQYDAYCRARGVRPARERGRDGKAEPPEWSDMHEEDLKTSRPAPRDEARHAP